VWVALHHEPEGDGTLSDWVAMQKRLSPILRAKPNIAFTVITTGWDTFFSGNSAYSLAALVPDPSIIDVLGFDAYNEYGVTKNGTTSTTMTEMKQYYVKIAAWSAAHGNKPWAMAETGYTDAAANHDAAWLTRAYADMKTYGGVGLSYFDSNLNPLGGDLTWPLDLQSKRDAFAGDLALSVRW